MKFLVLLAMAFALAAAMMPEANARRCEHGPYIDGCAEPEGVAHHPEHRPHHRDYR
jgi:RecB family exonuclease